MKYFKDNDDNVFAYDDEQLKNGLADGKTEITEEEKDLLTYVEPTEEQLISEQKRDGETYPNTEYKVSFTSDDAIGMMQVKNAFELGILQTNIKFSNGTVMPIQSDEFTDFAVWFANKRNSFFI